MIFDCFFMFDLAKRVRMADVVQFVVGNTWTQITQSDPFILHILDKESQYPTDQALMCGGTWRPPGNANGWDGWIRLLRQPKTRPPYFPSGLLTRLSRICAKMGYDAQVHDTRIRPETGFSIVPQVSLRDYQQNAVEAGFRLGRGVFELPPRSGKTRAMIELHRRISLPTIWTAPTDRIVQQTARAVEEIMGDPYCYHLVGCRNAALAAKYPVVVCTAATAASLPAEFYQTRQMLVIDEWHHSCAKSYTSGIVPKCDHIFFRYGMTGTNFRSGEDDLAMRGILSDTVAKVSSEELVCRGFLVPTKVVFVPMPAHPKLRGAGTSFHGGFGAAGLHEHSVRNSMVAQSAAIFALTGRRVLVLVGTKIQGRLIAQNLTPLISAAPSGTEFSAVEFLSTDRPRPVQTRVIQSFLDGAEVKVLIGTSLLGEGVDLPAIDVLVYARGEKAEVSLTQNAYRVCTAVEGKSHAVIVDFADRHHRKLLAHSEQRLASYLSEPTFEVSTLKSFNDLPAWLNAGCPVAIDFGS